MMPMVSIFFLNVFIFVKDNTFFFALNARYYKQIRVCIESRAQSTYYMKNVPRCEQLVAVADAVALYTPVICAGAFFSLNSRCIVAG